MILEKKVFISKNLNPYQNLFFEKELMSLVSKNEMYLFLWKSLPAVVIGRNQNVWREVNVPFIKKNRILLVRRQSGGGAVYHDPQNINFSFITKKDQMIKENLLFICDSVKDIGIHLEINKRSDLLLNNLKVSGSSFRKTKDAFLHHGTLLVNSDLSDLSKSLKPISIDLKCRSVCSVRSKVTNLKHHYSFAHTNLIESILAHNFSTEIHIIDHHEMKKNDMSQEEYKNHWFQNKEFSFKLYAQNEELNCIIKNGQINHLSVNGSSVDEFRNIDFEESFFSTVESRISNDFIEQLRELSSLRSLVVV